MYAARTALLKSLLSPVRWLANQSHKPQHAREMRPRRAVFEMCRAFLRSQISLKKKREKNESLKIKTEEQRIKTDTIHFSRNFIEARKVRPQVKNDHDSSGNPARSSTPVLRENSTP